MIYFATHDMEKIRTFDSSHGIAGLGLAPVILSMLGAVSFAYGGFGLLRLLQR